ncbi:hypothetical protein [Streptomyces sp. CBMA123]|uniref:hypothetical protein n=1 Tax=Streptomyces sp. CBMA123 TaxID=1896313 RepID=UPI001661BB5A|nr:hypothetical protein [Streptomyces sp. CBMA123]
MDDLRAGRWLSTQRLLAATAQNAGLRTSRTQVLALVAARSTVLTDWAREDPDDPGLAIVRTRVMVEHALAAAEAGSPEAERLEQEARESCQAAAQAVRSDPVPWVCLIALAALDRARQRPEHQQRSSDPMLPPGPWGLLDEALRRDPGNREAHHRMLRYWHQVYRPAAADFVNVVMSMAPAGSPLSALPLYLSVDYYRNEPRRNAVVLRQWLREPHFSRAQRAYEGWSVAEPGAWPVVDLSYLAHALWASAQMAAAVEVFSALGQFASKAPWTHVADSPEKAEALLLIAREQALAGRATALA